MLVDGLCNVCMLVSASRWAVQCVHDIVSASRWAVQCVHDIVIQCCGCVVNGIPLYKRVLVNSVRSRERGLQVYIPELNVDSREVPPGRSTNGAVEVDCGGWRAIVLPHGSQAKLAEGVATVQGHGVVED